MSARQRNLIVAVAALVLVVIGVVAIALHGDSSGHPSATTPSTTPTSSSSRPSTTAPAADRCHSADLSVSYRLGNGAGGHEYAIYTVTNNSGRECTMYGYPGVQLISGDGTPIPTNTRRGGDYILDPAPPSTVTLAPGATAGFGVGWTGVCPNDSTPVKAPTAAVIPPDEQQQILVQGEVWECPQDQTVDVTPVRAAGVPIAVGGDAS